MQALMNPEILSSSPVLATFRCSDPEAITRRLSGTRRRLLPLASAFDFLQVELRLGDLRLAVVKRPACTSESYLDPAEIGIGLSLQDSSGLRLDGRPLDRPALVTHGLSVPHRIFQPGQLIIAAVFVPEATGDRGWPDRVGTARIDLVGAQDLAGLRTTVRDVVRLASRDPRRFSHESVVSGMRQSVLGGIDHAFLTAPAAQSAGLAIGNYVRICRRADEFIRANARDLPSSAVVAAAAAVAVAITIVTDMTSARKFMTFFTDVS